MIIQVFSHKYLYWRTLYFHISSSHCLESFCYNYNDFFIIFSRLDLVIINSLNFCLSEKLLISPPFLKDSCDVYGILSQQVCFSLNILSHYFQACRLSVEKYVDNLTEACLYVTNHFLLQLLDDPPPSPPPPSTPPPPPTFHTWIITYLSICLFEFTLLEL